MTSKNDKVIASNRLGFGAKPGDEIHLFESCHGA
jgi:hypothetical protein